MFTFMLVAALVLTYFPKFTVPTLVVVALVVGVVAWVSYRCR